MEDLLPVLRCQVLPSIRGSGRRRQQLWLQVNGCGVVCTSEIRAVPTLGGRAERRVETSQIKNNLTKKAGSVEALE